MRIALLPWGQVVEDYLDPLGLDVDALCSEMTGGWLFGWVRALQSAGVEPSVVCVSRAVHRDERRTHAPTGVPVWLVPPALPYRLGRSLVDDPYAWDGRRAVRACSSRPRTLAGRVVHHLLPHLSTPPIALRRALRALDVDAVVCQEYEDARLDVCLAVGRSLRVPVFATFQGGSASRTALERVLRRLAVRSCAGLIVGSAAEAERIDRAYGPGVGVSRIANPVEIGDWPVGDRQRARDRLGIDAAARVVAWHGRIDIYRKGLDVLLDAWATIVTARPDQSRHLLLVGSGSDSASLHRMLAERRLESVQWLDEYVLDRAVIREHLAAADVAVCPSRVEGFPVALLESMASGRAVVASDASGIPEVVTGELAGGLVVPAGDVAALASALGSLLDDPSRAERMGAAARRRVETAFSLEAIGAALATAITGTGTSRGNRGRVFRS